MGGPKPWSNIRAVCKLCKHVTIIDILTKITERQSLHFLLLFLSPKQTKIHIPEAEVFELCFCLYLSETEKTQSKKRQKKKEQTWARVTQKGGTINPENLICLPGYSTGKLHAEQNPASPINQTNLFYRTFVKQNAELQYAFQSHNMCFYNFISTSYLLSQIYGLSWSLWSVLRRPEPRPCNETVK